MPDVGDVPDLPTHADLAIVEMGQASDLAVPLDLAECAPLGPTSCGAGVIPDPHGSCCGGAFCSGDIGDGGIENERCCLRSGAGLTGCTADDQCCSNGGYLGVCSTAGQCCYVDSIGQQWC